VRAAGAVTRALAALEPGMPLGVRGPFGTPWPLAACTGRDVLVVAGGIGLAPLRSAIAAIRRERDRYGRVAIIVGGRSPDTLIYAEELQAWRADSTLQVETIVDHAGPAWRHDVGVVTDMLPRAQVDAERTTALLCGPEVMMRVAADALADRRVPADAIAVSLERNMKCAIGHCGHCQLGPAFICKDGPVLPWNRVAGLLREGEI
jgi:NAD(P)H-flavin reductase